MKKLFLLLALLGMVATGCSKDEVDKGNDNKTEQPNENEGGNENDDDEKPVFEIDAEGSYTIPAEGAEIKVNITTNLEYRVEVSEDAKAWLSIGDTRAVRTETLIFTVAKNESDRERTATITIFNKDDEKVFEFRLTQKFNDKADIPENIFFGLDKESVTISPDGGSVDVIVYSNYKWEISGTSDWCTPSVKGGDANEDGQKVTFSADLTYDDREATFWFRCANQKIKFIVSQKLKQVIIPDANNTFNFPAEGGVAVISYQASVDCEVIIPKDAQSWITIAPASRGLVSENINLDIAENTTYSARTAVIKVVAKDNAELTVEYTINQEQNDALLADENNTFTVPSMGGEVVINYQTNIDCEIIIPEEAQDWITIVPETRGLVAQSATLHIAENTTYDSRSAVIKVVAKDNAELVVEYTINQEQNDAILADENNTFTVPSAGGEVVINYQTNIDCDVIIPDDAQDWVTIAPATRGLVSESITLNIAENTTYSSRTAVVKVVAKDNAELAVEYTINQEQNDAVLANGNTEFTISGREQQITIEHKANVDCDVIIPDEAQDWITIAPATRGLSIYITTLNIAENNSDEERSCVVKVISQDNNKLSAEYTIIQNPRYYLYYTTNDGKIVQPAFGATIISNTYKDGVGVIEFDAPITTIGYAAFAECSSLTSVTIPDSVTTIGEWTFAYCSSLTSVTIGDSVTTIGYAAFYYCSNLTSVTIPDSVTTIGDYAFRYCSSLTSVTIGDSVTTIGDEAFAGCNGLQEFNGKFASEDGRCLIIDGVLNYFAPVGLTEYTIPDSVTTIGNNAFYNCISLTSVTIPDSVTTIGDYAFYGCTGELIINSKIVETDYTYNNYPSYYGWLSGAKFTKLTIGDSVTTIGDYAFYSCDSLTSVTIGDIVTTIGNYAFYRCSNLTSVTIGDSVTMIGDAAFLFCSSLTSVTIPDSVTSIGSSAFCDCRSLTSVTIPNSVTTIGDAAFQGCSSLTSVTIPDSVTSIGDSAFYSCDSLTSVTIPDSVTSIGYRAFYECSNLTSVYCKPTTPPAVALLYNSHWNAFDGNAPNRKIYVPMESVEAYKSASYWKIYADAIVGYDF